MIITVSLRSRGYSIATGMQVKFGEGRRYTYKGGYFENRELVRQGKGDWDGCPDIFGDGPGAGVYA